MDVDVDLLISKMKMDFLSPDYQLLICLLFENGLRSSEITAGGQVRYLGNGRFSVFQKKTKSWRFCFCSKPDLYAHLAVNDFVTSIMYLNRMYLWRLFKKWGIYEQLPEHQKLTVTHLPRHEVANQILAQTNNAELIQQALGHKSRKSQESYIGKKAAKTTVRGVDGFIPAEASTAVVITKKGVIRARRRDTK